MVGNRATFGCVSPQIKKKPRKKGLKEILNEPEIYYMSDLSKVLGDLYGATDPDGPPVKQEAPAAERAAAEQEPASETVTGGTDEDLQTVLNEALAKAPKTAPATAIEEADEWADSLEEKETHSHQKGELKAWTRSDDDYLPFRGRKWNHRNKHH